MDVKCSAWYLTQSIINNANFSHYHHYHHHHHLRSHGLLVTLFLPELIPPYTYLSLFLQIVRNKNVISLVPIIIWSKLVSKSTFIVIQRSPVLTESSSNCTFYIVTVLEIEFTQHEYILVLNVQPLENYDLPRCFTLKSTESQYIWLQFFYPFQRPQLNKTRCSSWLDLNG